MRRTRWARRPGSSSLNTSSRRRSGGRPSSAVTRSSSASLRARIAVRCWPREAKRGEVAPVHQLECEVVAMRPDERRAVPDLLLGGLDEPPGQGVARRFAGGGRRVRLVSQRQGTGGGLLRRDLGMGRRERPGKLLEQRVPGRDDRATGIEERPIPVPQLVAARPAPRGSRAAGRCAAGARDRTSRGRSRSAGRGWPRAGRGRARRRDGEPATRSMSSGANSTTRSTPAERRCAARRPR